MKELRIVFKKIWDGRGLNNYTRIETLARGKDQEMFNI